jgi:hypothetical protein
MLRGLTTHSTGARDSMAFIVLPAIRLNAARPRPVNSSVGLLLIHARLEMSQNSLSGGLPAGSSLNISATWTRFAHLYVE